jgi:cytochrome d ubiquinol oxidase subunit II
MTAIAVAACIGASLVVYALMAGADFGAGLWDLVASGPRAERQRHAIAGAIAPIWEANHVWLILVVVLLFSGFPSAFAVVMTALNIPITVMLLGIVARGAAFVFREYDGGARGVRRWTGVFGAASLCTPLVQGMTIGALATGRIRVTDGLVTSGFLAGWTTPFALSCGIFALGLFAFLAATYLTLDARREPDLQDDFRRRAIGAGLSLVPLALVVLATGRHGAPELFHGVTRWWAPWLLALTGACAVAALVALWTKHFTLARAAAAGQVALILCGWCLAQFPRLVVPDVTVANAHAPEATLRLLLVALACGAVVLLPSLVLLFRLFKSGKSAPA